MIIAKVALQVILGLIFLFTGSIKLLTPKESLSAKGVTGLENIPAQRIKYLAWAEVTGALMLLVFSVPTLPQVISKIALVAFALLLISATFHHLKRREHKSVAMTLILLATCVGVWVLIDVITKHRG